MKKMLSIMLFVLATQTANGAEALFQGLLQSLPENPEVVILELTLLPGQVGNPHRHDAWVYVYVLEGAVDMQVEGGPVTRVSTGEMFLEGPEDIHVMNNNASTMEQARFLAILIKDANKPVVLPAN